MEKEEKLRKGEEENKVVEAKSLSKQKNVVEPFCAVCTYHVRLTERISVKLTGL